MSNNEKKILSILIQERLLANWNKCDQLGSVSEYESITNECNMLHNISRKLNLNLSDVIEARF